MRKEEIVITVLSKYLLQQLKLCILAAEHQGSINPRNAKYWAGARASAEALIELVSEENLNEALVDAMLQMDGQIT